MGPSFRWGDEIPVWPVNFCAWVAWLSYARRNHLHLSTSTTVAPAKAGAHAPIATKSNRADITAYIENELLNWTLVIRGWAPAFAGVTRFLCGR